MSWPDWMFQRVPSEPIVFFLVIAGGLALILGAVSLLAARRLRQRDKPSAVERRQGCWQLADGALYLLLAGVLLRRANVDLWAALVLLAVSLPVIATFAAWARQERMVASS